MRYKIPQSKKMINPKIPNVMIIRRSKINVNFTNVGILGI